MSTTVHGRPSYGPHEPQENDSDTYKEVAPQDTYKEIAPQDPRHEDNSGLQVSDRDCALQASDRDCTLEVNLREQDTQKQAITPNNGNDLEAADSGKSQAKPMSRKCFKREVPIWKGIAAGLVIAIIVIVIVVAAPLAVINH